MAGIGFQLHKLIEDESFLARAKAYIFASIITSGPWILSIICLGLIGLLSGSFLGGEFSVMSITIVYTFAFSLILTGPVQFILTRYLADKEYLKQKDSMLSALISAMIITLFLSLLVSVPWYILAPGSILYKTSGIVLFVIICSIWTMMDFLSCLKNYGGIIIAFFIGSIVSLVLALVIGKYRGVDGALSGYAAGQFIILTVLLVSIKKEFSFNGIFNKEFLKYFRLFPYILFSGLFYNLGLWTDKLMGWFILGEKIAGNYRAYGIYDTPIFIAYLSIIPSLAYFMIQSETNFFLVHRRFFDSIATERLQNILSYKEDLVKTLKKSIVALFTIQVITSGAGSALAGIIAGAFSLPGESVVILRILFFAAGGQVMFLYIIIFLMYFDLSKISFYMVAIFFILNFTFNAVLIRYPLLPYGSGYCAAITATMLLGLGLLLNATSDMEYRIFMRQENT